MKTIPEFPLKTNDVYIIEISTWGRLLAMVNTNTPTSSADNTLFDGHKNIPCGIIFPWRRSVMLSMNKTLALNYYSLTSSINEINNIRW